MIPNFDSNFFTFFMLLNGIESTPMVVCYSCALCFLLSNVILCDVIFSVNQYPYEISINE